MPTKYYTIKEIQQILKISRKTVLSYIHNEKLQAVKAGKLWRIPQEGLEKFLER